MPINGSDNGKVGFDESNPYDTYFACPLSRLKELTRDKIHELIDM